MFFFSPFLVYFYSTSSQIFHLLTCISNYFIVPLFYLFLTMTFFSFLFFHLVLSSSFSSFWFWLLQPSSMFKIEENDDEGDKVRLHNRKGHSWGGENIRPSFFFLPSVVYFHSTSSQLYKLLNCIPTYFIVPLFYLFLTTTFFSFLLFLHLFSSSFSNVFIKTPQTELYVQNGGKWWWRRWSEIK